MCTLCEKLGLLSRSCRVPGGTKAACQPLFSSDNSLRAEKKPCQCFLGSPFVPRAFLKNQDTNAQNGTSPLAVPPTLYFGAAENPLELHDRFHFPESRGVVGSSWVLFTLQAWWKLAVFTFDLTWIWDFDCWFLHVGCPFYFFVRR